MINLIRWLIVVLIFAMVIKAYSTPDVIEDTVEQQPVATTPVLIEREWYPTPKKRIRFEKPW